MDAAQRHKERQALNTGSDTNGLGIYAGRRTAIQKKNTG